MRDVKELADKDDNFNEEQFIDGTLMAVKLLNKDDDGHKTIADGKCPGAKKMSRFHVPKAPSALSLVKRAKTAAKTTFSAAGPCTRLDDNNAGKTNMDT
jgi:hypothetical protein